MIFDLHNDYLTARPDLAFLPQSKAAFKPIAGVIYAIWTTELSDCRQFIINAAGLKKMHKDFLVAIEDLGFLFRASPMTKTLFDILALRPVYASLTWNGENSLAGGADTNVGLKPFGKAMIGFLAKNGVILDTAHLSRPAFYQSADCYANVSQSGVNAGIICSHTCFDGIYCHRRNLTDRQIRLLISLDGLIGLCLVPQFMGKPRADADDLLRQIDYFVQRFGLANLAIGSDFFGTKYPALKGYRSFALLNKKLTRLGYKSDDIDKIFFKNAQNYIYSIIIKKQKTGE